MSCSIRNTIFGIMFGMAALVSFSQAQPALDSYLPDNDEIEGWIRDGEAAAAVDLKSSTRRPASPKSFKIEASSW